MHVTFIGTRGVPASYSGFETCVEQVGRRMVRAGHRVTVACRSSHYRERPRSHLGMELSHLPSIPQKHLDTISHTAISAPLIASDSAIVCMGVGNAPVVRLLELGGRRTVFNVDGADWMRDKWDWLARRYLRWCEGLAARGRSTLVADAVAVQRYYQTEYGRMSELVAYGAEPPVDMGTSVLEELGLEPGRYVLFVGRLVPENGPHDFIEGMCAAGLPVPGVIVGDAPYSNEYISGLRRMASAQVRLVGYQFAERYQQLSAHAGAYVLAASVGGTHPVLLEQMAAGNCVLARDTESDREVLGEAGLFWSTAGELADSLRNVWSKPGLRKRLGLAARKRAGDLYDWDAVTARYLELCAGSLS